MISPRASWSWMVVSIAAASLLLSGCGGDPTLSQRFIPDPASSDGAEEGIEASGLTGSNPSIVGCVAESLCATLRSSYVGRDLESYSRLFTSDFTFVFSPPDVMHPHEPTPAQWGLADELAAHDHLFHDDRVNRIALTFDVGRPFRSAVYPGSWRVELTHVRLSVFLTIDGVPWEYRVADGRCVLYLERSGPARSAEGGEWRISRWEDDPPWSALSVIRAARGGPPPVVVLRWGRMKFWWR